MQHGKSVVLSVTLSSSRTRNPATDPACHLQIMERQHHVQEEKAEKSHQAEQSQDQQAGKRAEKTEEEAQEALIQPVNGPLLNGPFADKPRAC